MKNYVLYKGISGQDFVSCENEDGTFASFLTDPANSDYQAYLATLVTESAPTAQ